jgi:hypothetical protein
LRTVPEEFKSLFDRFVLKGFSYITDDGETLLYYYLQIALPPELSVVEYIIRQSDNIGHKTKFGETVIDSIFCKNFEHRL